LISLSACIGIETTTEDKKLSTAQQAGLKAETAPQIKGLYAAGFAPDPEAYRYKDGKTWHLGFSCAKAPAGHTCAEEASEVDLILAAKPDGDKKLAFKPGELVAIGRNMPPAGTPEYECKVPYENFTKPGLVWDLPGAVRKIHTRDETTVTVQGIQLKCRVTPLSQPS
jgi:hypothetical protein